MDTIMTKSLDTPDKSVEFPNGSVATASVGSIAIARMRFEPGWRWSNDVKPMFDTDLCPLLHRGYCLSGTLHVRAEDGTEMQIGAGEAYVIAPSHDAWVIGDEAWTAVDFTDRAQDPA
jgi:hypothetical protein